VGRPGHPERGPFVVAVLITGALAAAFQGIAPVVGWFGGVAFEPPLLLQVMVYGWSLTAAAALFLAIYRALVACFVQLGLLVYVLIVLLLGLGTALGDRMYLESGVFEFENGYTVFSDVLYLFALLGLPLAIFEAARRRSS
jgi:hypothetical protein